jgi:Magnesium chelatase, subunit ChlI
MPMPGEVSLAHYGMWFLDEWPERKRHILLAIPAVSSGTGCIGWGRHEIVALLVSVRTVGQMPIGYTYAGKVANAGS